MNRSTHTRSPVYVLSDVICQQHQLRLRLQPPLTIKHLLNIPDIDPLHFSWTPFNLPNSSPHLSYKNH